MVRGNLLQPCNVVVTILLYFTTDPMRINNAEDVCMHRIKKMKSSQFAYLL